MMEYPDSQQVRGGSRREARRTVRGDGWEGESGKDVR